MKKYLFIAVVFFHLTIVAQNSEVFKIDSLPKQGTGLGLSLAYDIVKAHGGELKVKTKEGEGCEFIVQLPALSKIP
jgi:signal transduction histidine kinase